MERRLRTIMYILESNSNNPAFLLYSIKYNIDLKSRNKILHTIEAMLDEILQVKEKFNLEEEVESLKRIITVNLDEIWTTLEDTRPEKMGGVY